MTKFNYNNSEGVYTAKYEKVFQLETGYYLLYYHKPEWWRIPSLFLKFAIPIAVLIYYIRKNPFY
jgi:hypothetical protein